MNKIKSIELYKLQHAGALNKTNATGVIAMISVFNAVQQITQEINAVMHVMSDPKIFPGKDDPERCAKHAAAIFGNDQSCNLRELIRIHAANLYSFIHLIDAAGIEPKADTYFQRAEEREKLPEKYFANGWEPIISQFMCDMADVLNEISEVNQDGGDE